MSPTNPTRPANTVSYTTDKSRAVGMSTAFAAPYGRDPNRTHITPREPEFIATIKARAAIRASFAKGRQTGFRQTHLAAGAFGPIPVVLTYSGGLWRAVTQWGALVASHFCYTECARRAKLQGFVPVSAA